ncbi:MAG TPA: N-acetylmuramoyl-L-alanine amidase [Anaerovoracaceae bacterium]|nr:N-acetylmuramoyl-L-alanine amidase [Anaerovoracaceae bacterium]
MPAIYLSPSVQEFNPYIIGGNEEYYMNRLADAMVPYLRASGISFTRNNPGNTLSQVIAQSNAGNYDLHLALHSNSSPENMRGVLQGPDVYFFTTSAKGHKAADMIAANLKNIYSNSSLVTVIPTTTLAEVRKTRAPAVLVETAYQDNYADATWLRDNINLIARNLVQSLTEYFGISFVDLLLGQNDSAK